MNSGQDDINAFNSWDCFGATLMLAAVPAAMNYVFTEEHEIGSTIGIFAVGFVSALVVLVVSLITRWRIIGKLVNLAGAALTPVYVVVLICHWLPDSEQPAPQQEAAQPAAPALPNKEV